MIPLPIVTTDRRGDKEESTRRAGARERRALVQRERSKARRSGLETRCIEQVTMKRNTCGPTWRQEVETEESPGSAGGSIYMGVRQ